MVARSRAYQVFHSGSSTTFVLQALVRDMKKVQASGRLMWSQSVETIFVVKMPGRIKLRAMGSEELEKGGGREVSVRKCAWGQIAELM